MWSARFLPAARALLATLFATYAANSTSQSIRDADIKAGRVRSDLPAGVGTGSHYLQLDYIEGGAEGCLWDSTGAFSGCPGRAGLPDRPGGVPVWAGTLQRSAACGGSTTRIGNSWIGCIAYDTDAYFSQNSPTDAYWVLVANDDPAFDQCNEGPPGSSHRVTAANAQPQTMFKLDVLPGTGSRKRLRLALDLGEKDFFCPRAGAYEYSIPFLSIGAQNGRGNAGPVGTIARRGSPRGTIAFDAAISSHSTIGCASGTQTICSPASNGIHAGLYAYATWAGMPHLVFIDLYGSGVLDYSGGPPGESKWNWPVHDSFQFPGAEVLYASAGDTLQAYCGIDVPRLDLAGTHQRYAIDFGRILACFDALGLIRDPMPGGDIALDGVHWYIEASGTQGSLGIEIAHVETSLFTDGFD